MESDGGLGKRWYNGETRWPRDLQRMGRGSSKSKLRSETSTLAATVPVLYVVVHDGRLRVHGDQVSTSLATMCAAGPSSCMYVQWPHTRKPHDALVWAVNNSRPAPTDPVAPLMVLPIYAESPNPDAAEILLRCVGSQTVRLRCLRHAHSCPEREIPDASVSFFSQTSASSTRRSPSIATCSDAGLDV